MLASRITGILRSTPSYDTIEEIQVISTGASAEYGNYIGAAVNVVTKSGTNDFRGSLTVFYTGGTGWFADNSGGLPTLLPDRYKYDVPIAGTFSGPLIREKLSSPWVLVITMPNTNAKVARPFTNRIRSSSTTPKSIGSSTTGTR